MKNHILRRGSFSRFPYLGKYIAVKGSIVRPLVDVPWNERDEPNFRFDDAKFDGGGGLSSRRIRCRRRMRILRVFAGPIFLETVEQRPKTVADFLLPYPPDNGRFYLQLTESRCFASSRRRERERESWRVKFGVKSALRCDGTWIFIPVPGCGLFTTPGVFLQKIGKNGGGEGCKIWLLFFLQKQWKMRRSYQVARWNFIREFFFELFDASIRLLS